MEPLRRPLFDQQTRDVIMLTGASTGITWLSVAFLERYLRYLREKNGLPPLEDGDGSDAVRFGASLGIVGGMSQQWYSPIVVGLGLGNIAHGVSKVLTIAPRQRADLADAWNDALPDHLQPTLKYRSLPYFRRSRYEALSGILRDIVVKPAYNEQRKETVPSGFEHPIVVGVARNILSALEVDGHDHENVAQAVKTYFDANYTYAYDPRRRGGDYFVHPWVFFEKYNMTGDCDDVSISICSVLMALGVPSCMVMVAQKNRDCYNHIFPAALLDPAKVGKVPPDRMVRDPNGQKWVLAPIEVTRKTQWGYHPRYLRRGFVWL